MRLSSPKCSASKVGQQPWYYWYAHNSSPHSTFTVGRFSYPDCTLSTSMRCVCRSVPKKAYTRTTLPGPKPRRGPTHTMPAPTRATAGLGGRTPPTLVRLLKVSLYTQDPAQSVAMSADTDGLPPQLGIDRFHASRQQYVHSPGRGNWTHPWTQATLKELRDNSSPVG